MNFFKDFSGFETWNPKIFGKKFEKVILLTESFNLMYNFMGWRLGERVENFLKITTFSDHQSGISQNPDVLEQNKFQIRTQRCEIL